MGCRIYIHFHLRPSLSPSDLPVYDADLTFFRLLAVAYQSLNGVLADLTADCRPTGGPYSAFSTE
jgi:hypothetical protein